MQTLQPTATDDYHASKDRRAEQEKKSNSTPPPFQTEVFSIRSNSNIVM